MQYTIEHSHIDIYILHRARFISNTKNLISDYGL